MINMCCKSGIQRRYLPPNVVNPSFIGTAQGYIKSTRSTAKTDTQVSYKKGAVCKYILLSTKAS